MDQSLTLKIILENPVPGITYGLQEGSGANYTTTQQQTAQSDPLNFQCIVQVKSNKAGLPSFYGPFVQGPPQGRFLYLDVGSYAGQKEASCNGRLKIPLEGISKSTLEQSSPSSVFITTVSGRNARNNNPLLGTVKPFNGWTTEPLEKDTAKSES